MSLKILRKFKMFSRTKKNVTAICGRNSDLKVLIFICLFWWKLSSTTALKQDYYGVHMRRIPMMRLDIISQDEPQLKREMTDSSSIFSLEMSLEPFHKRWVQFAVVLLNGHSWRVTSTEIGCPGRGGSCPDDQVIGTHQLHLQLTKTSDCPTTAIPKSDLKPLKLKLIRLSFTVRNQDGQWRSVHFNVTDVQVDDPCNVDAQPTAFDVKPVFAENVDCASSQPLTKSDPFKGFYLRDGEYINTTWCEHTCTCRNGNLLCKSLECSLRYNPNKERGVWMAGECCQLADHRDHFEEDQCTSQQFQWPILEDPQRKMLVQLFRMPLWTVPYIVVHRPAYMSICMATFIHRRWMLTSANCLFYEGKQATPRQVVFATTFFRLRLKRIQIHPDFEPSIPRSPVGDLALFELEADQPFGIFQQQLNLPTTHQCSLFLTSNCTTLTSLYGNDVNEFLFGMSSTLGVRTTRFPFPRNIIARLAQVDRMGGEGDDSILKITFPQESPTGAHRAGIPSEAGCISADGSALVMHQGPTYFLVGVVTPTEKGALGSTNTGDSMCHESHTDVVTVCPYLDWIKLILTLPTS